MATATPSRVAAGVVGKKTGDLPKTVLGVEPGPQATTGHPGAKSGKAAKKMGAPSKLTPQMAAHVFMLSRRGFTNKEIAELKGIDEDTLTNWQVDPAFFGFLNAAKDVSDKLVERSLFERAVGYTYTTQEVVRRKRGDDEVVDVEHKLPPDPTSCIFWLKNRKRLEWRERTADEAESGKTPRVTFVVNVNGTPQRVESSRFAELMKANGNATAALA